MPGGVGVDPEVLVIDGLERAGTQSQHLGLGGVNVRYPQIQVYLLWRPIGPLWRNVVRSELHGQEGPILDEDAVPVLLLAHCSTREFCPERAFRLNVRSVEDHDRVLDVHLLSVARRGGFIPFC